MAGMALDKLSSGQSGVEDSVTRGLERNVVGPYMVQKYAFCGDHCFDFA